MIKVKITDENEDWLQKARKTKKEKEKEKEKKEKKKKADTDPIAMRVIARYSQKPQ
jgi:hypothetical protein